MALEKKSKKIKFALSGVNKSLPPVAEEPFIESDMVYIEGGTFYMGSETTIFKPVHRVFIDTFYIGKYPVTNREYCLYDSSHENRGDNLPVVNVKWKEAAAYCQWLTDKTGKNYRLPTEAEWEYACRAGNVTEYYWGNEMDGDYCWYCDNSGGKVNPVGQKKANAFGLYDMSGNVWECCSDYYDDTYYRTSPSRNPGGPKSGVNRVFRGGGWGTSAAGCRSACRGSGRQNYAFDFVGFRTVRSQK